MRSTAWPTCSAGPSTAAPRRTTAGREALRRPVIKPRLWSARGLGVADVGHGGVQGPDRVVRVQGRGQAVLAGPSVISRPASRSSAITGQRRTEPNGVIVPRS